MYAVEWAASILGSGWCIPLWDVLGLPFGIQSNPDHFQAVWQTTWRGYQNGLHAAAAAGASEHSDEALRAYSQQLLTEAYQQIEEVFGVSVVQSLAAWFTRNFGDQVQESRWSRWAILFAALIPKARGGGEVSGPYRPSEMEDATWERIAGTLQWLTGPTVMAEAQERVSLELSRPRSDFEVHASDYGDGGEQRNFKSTVLMIFGRERAFRTWCALRFLLEEPEQQKLLDWGARSQLAGLGAGPRPVATYITCR